ncbi:MAG TPA: CHAD domain-containing protein [Pilimelia sp.]|nr:CHAD domain-containing protein [Pilimelia sp.]
MEPAQRQLSRGVQDLLAYAGKQRDAVVHNESGARRGDEDGVHDMRVAIRRLRSTLRSFRGLWERDRSEALRGELKWLADQLGPVRDSHVMGGRLAKAIEAEPPELVVGPVATRVRRHFDADTAEALGRLRDALDSDRYHRILAELDALVSATPARPRGGGWVRRRGRRALRRADRMLDEANGQKASGGAKSSDDRNAALHEARKAYKRARYAVEVLAGRAGKPASRLAKRISKLQDVLGAHQDSVITREVLRDEGTRAQGAGESAFTYGLLHGRQRALSDRVLRRLPRVVRRSRRGRVRNWLR